MMTVIPGAEALSYDALLAGSELLSFAESALPPSLSGKGGFVPRPGASRVPDARVREALALPAGTTIDALSKRLRGEGTLSHRMTWRDGQMWTAHLEANEFSGWLLFVDAAHFRSAPYREGEAASPPDKYLVTYSEP